MQYLNEKIENSQRKGLRYFLGGIPYAGQRGAVNLALKNAKKMGFPSLGKEGQWELMIVNQKELAECLGVTARNIRDISKGFGIFEKNESGKYDLKTCIKEYIDYKLDLDSNRTKGLNLEALKARHEEIKIQMSMEKLKEYKAETHRSEDVEEFLSNMLVSFKNKLSTLPSKLAMEIMGETDTNAAIKKVEEEIDMALNELSGYDPNKISRKRKNVELDEDLEEIEEENDIKRENKKVVSKSNKRNTKTSKSTKRKPVGRKVQGT